MPHTYRKITHWDRWLHQHAFGHLLQALEAEQVKHLTRGHYGKHALVIGTDEQYSLLSDVPLPCKTLLSPIASSCQSVIESDLHDLPLLAGSVDFVLIPHTLELVDNPRQVLSEACRVIKPEGLIMVVGFNPYSLWGLYQLISGSKKQLPLANHRINAHQVKCWLQLADFQVEEHSSAMFIPSVYPCRFRGMCHAIEKAGQVCLPKLGGIYFVVARAKVIPLSPIKLKWKQQLSGIRVPNSIPGHIARQQE